MTWDNMWLQFSVDILLLLLFFKFSTDVDNEPEQNILMSIGFLIAAIVFFADVERFWPQLTALFT